MPGLLIHGARQVLTLRGAASPRRGTALRNLSIIEDGSILIEDGRIRDVGPTRRIENLAAARGATQVSARGRVVLPGFVDSHVSLIGDLEPASQLRLIRKTPAWRLLKDATALLRRCLRYGTTAMEVKTCPALDEVSTLKVLFTVAGLSKEQPIDIISTYCGATAVPLDFRNDIDNYVQRLISRILPALKDKQLADFIEFNQASLNEQQRYLIREAADALEFPVKYSADLPPDSALAGAAAVEHLEGISAVDIRRLSQVAAVAVLMPTFAFHSAERRFAPARELIAQGAAVALASGYDRNINPSFSMPMAIELACRKLSMAPSEAIVAATLNGAYAVGRGDVTGSIEPGKRADILILETADYRDLAYETGVNPVDTTIVRGRIACQNSVVYGAAAGL